MSTTTSDKTETKPAKKAPQPEKIGGVTRPANTCLFTGNATKGGRFTPGGDAKLKSELQAAHVEGRKAKVLGGTKTVDPVEMAEALGWMRFLDGAKERAEAKAAKAAEREAAKAERAAAKAAKGKPAPVDVMEQAAVVLKAAGRYSGKNKIEITDANAASIVDGTLDALGGHAIVGQHRVMTFRGKDQTVVVQAIEGTRATVVYRNARGEDAERVIDVTSLHGVPASEG